MPKPKSNKLEPRQVEALRLLLLRKTQKEVAEQLGVNPQTVSRWTQLPHWQEALREIHAQFLQESVSILASAGVDASLELASLCKSEDEKVRLSACRTVLDNLARFSSNAARLTEETEVKPSQGLSDDTAAQIRAKILGLDPDDDEF